MWIRFRLIHFYLIIVMKIKVLKIRISDQYQNMDEAVVNDYFDRYDIINVSTNLINDDINFWSVLLHYQEKAGNSKPAKIKIKSESELSEEEMVIYNKLKKWRSEKSDALKIPSYIIFHNTHLMSIARYKPSNIEDMEYISGLGKLKIEKFGSDIIEILGDA